MANTFAIVSGTRPVSQAATNGISTLATSSTEAVVNIGRTTYGALVKHMSGSNVVSTNTGIGANGGNGKFTDVELCGVYDFFGARLLYENYDTAGTLTINGSAVAPSTGTGVGGNTLTWVDAPAVAAVPAAVVPVGSENICPGFRLGEMVSVTSLVRTAKPAGPRMLRARVHIPDNSKVRAVLQLVTSTYETNADNPGFTYKSGMSADTLANLKTNSNSLPTTYNDPSAAVGAVLFYDKPVAALAVFGDSNFQPSFGGGAGWADRLMWSFGASGLMISSANFAAAGESTLTSLEKAKRVLAEVGSQGITHAAMKCWSSNDGVTQVAFDRSWAATVRFVQLCRAAGVIPVVLDVPPSNGATQAMILQAKARVASLPDYVKKISIYDLLVDPLNANALRSDVNQGDNVHWLAPGHIAIANAAKLII